MLVAFLYAGILIGFVGLYYRFVLRSKGYAPFVEDFLREPGETLRLKREETLNAFNEMTFLFIVLLMAIFVAHSFIPGPSKFIVIAILTILAAYPVIRGKRLLDVAVKLRLGLEGERATGQELSLLMRDGAWVFHDLPYQYGNIDHVIVGRGGVCAVETKAVTKPKSELGPRSEWRVEFDGKALLFPHMATSNPLEQAGRHAKFLRSHLRKKLGIDTEVTPVVAIPGWFIKRTGKSNVWVINPKEKAELQKRLGQEKLSIEDTQRITTHLESIARSVRPGSKRLDPDASEYYDFWNNPRYRPPGID